MKNKKNTFQILAALTLLLVFSIKLGFSFVPNIIQTQKNNIVATTDQDSKDASQEDSKNEKKEFITEKFITITIQFAESKNICTHFYTLITRATNILIQPPKKSDT